MSDKADIPASPSEDDYVRQVASAEPPALLTSTDPFELFAEWMKEAVAKEPNDANAMSLATVDASGMPDVRMVLLKDAGPDGFVFYTNLGSAKGRQLAGDPKAALLFHWKSLRRQVRVRGTVTPTTPEEADAYFATRARPAQIGAWASDQSQPLPDRLALEKKIAEMGLKFGLGKVPRPPHWSGFRVRPEAIEFWRDRPFRLHERLVFARAGGGLDHPAPLSLTDLEEVEVVAWLEGEAERKIETGCAWVFLAGDTAFKVKKRVDLGFLDYSTLDLRLWALERELRFNRAATSDIYRAVRKITRASGGGLELDGSGAVVEYALEMRRFDESFVLAARPWAVDGPLAEAMGREVAKVHSKAPARPQGGGGKALKYTIDSNAKLMRELAPKLGADRVEALIAATDAEFFRHAPLLDARRDAGFARQCHADLHLGNILLEDGKPVLFDCIEFNDVLSDIDVQYDLAFLLMDLDFRRRRDAAVRVLSAYVDEGLRHFPAGLLEGLAALPLMMAVRAGVRAHVQAHSGDLDGASAYLDAGLRHLVPPPPKLTAVGGLSGSGKSTFARLIAPGLGASPGAVVLRTDEIRKRLMGVPPDASLPTSVYSPAFYSDVYEALLSEARTLLGAGRAVVLDATFIQPDLRGRVEDLAKAAGVPFHGVWLEAAPEVLAQRIEGREGDASEATVATLRMQLDRDVGPIDWIKVDASGPAQEAAEAWSITHGGAPLP